MSLKGIAIINCGIGNVSSVVHALNCLGGNCYIAESGIDLAAADGIILPGVGAFEAAMSNLRKSGLLEELTTQVQSCGKPLLGICVGMQLLASSSKEDGIHSGLGWIDGRVEPIAPTVTIRVPHVGWNNITPSCSSRLFAGIDADAHFYFDHSFVLECNERLITSTCEYGGTRIASVENNNIFATQFHPEKSQRNGLKLLRNFLNICAGRDSPLQGNDKPC